MNNQADRKKIKRGFFARIIDKLDKKMQEKAKSRSCCSREVKASKKSCCS